MRMQNTNEQLSGGSGVVKDSGVENNGCWESGDEVGEVGARPKHVAKGRRDRRDALDHFGC